jgi:polysaccharide biosynthesis protein PslG
MAKGRKFGKLLMAILMIVGMLLPVAGTGAANGMTAAEREMAATAPTDPYFFPETGHYLSGRFRQYWEERGGLFVFGFPLTKTYYEVSTDGNTYLTQYFERARFEYHPENKNNQPYDVLLTLVGNEVTEKRRGEAPFLPIANPNDGRAYFAETGHTLGGLFLQFWQKWGGLQNFGFPLSEPFEERNEADGNVYTVQYFERGRWELHPEIANPDYAVLLGLMGRERMFRENVAAQYRDPETSPPTGEFIPGGGPGLVPVAHIEYGVNAYLIGGQSDGSFNNATIGKTKEAGFGWVRIQLIWRDFEREPGFYDWAITDPQINAAHGAGLRIMLSVVKSPTWVSADGHLPESPGHLDAFYNLMRVVAGRYAGKVQAYEIWNEQNLAGEVGGTVRVEPYFNVLKNGYLGVKKNDPTAWVLFGGLTPTGVKGRPEIALDDVDYLRAFYAYNGGQGKQYYDALAAHPGSAANPPDTRYPNGTGECPPAAIERYGAANGTCWNSSPDFYFRRIEEQRQVMEQNGESAKTIWLTEFGWDSCVGAPAPRGYEYCQLTTREEQAQYIVRAFQIGKNEWPWMGVMFLWNLNYAAIPGISPEDEKYGWSILGPGFTNLPAFEAVKAMPK